MGTGWNTLGLDNTGMSWVFIIARSLQLYCTLVLEVLLDFSPHERAVKRQMRVAKRWERKTSGPHVHWETEGHYFRTSDWIFPELFVSRLLVKGTVTLKTRLEWDKECYGKTHAHALAYAFPVCTWCLAVLAVSACCESAATDEKTKGPQIQKSHVDNSLLQYYSWKRLYWF